MAKSWLHGVRSVALRGWVVTSVAAGACVWAEEPGVESSFESVWASDIRLLQGQVSAGLKQRGVETKYELSVASIGLDYQPNTEIDLVTKARAVEETRAGGLFSVRGRTGEWGTLLGSVGGYRGFGSHRSVWINEWFRQWFAGLPGLRSAEPFGLNGSAGFRWEYQPGTGFVQADLTFARDRIAPGYEELIDPEQGLIAVTPLRDDLNTRAAQLTFENVLTPRLRSQVELRLTDQSERGLRVGVVASLNYAIAENWVIRAESGYIREALDEENVPPSVRSDAFVSWWFGGAVERQLGDAWHLSVSGRYYRDNGEIENSISFSAAAPEVTTWHAGLGVRWHRDHHAVKLFGGGYIVEHADVNFGTLFFQSLYRDRTFAIAQIAYRYEF